MSGLSRTFTSGAVAVALLVSSAQAATIDFEDGDRSFVRQSQDENACIDYFTVEHDGFTFRNHRDCGSYYEYYDGVVADNMALFFATSGDPTNPRGAGPSRLQMSATDGGLFDLYSLDLLRGAEDFVEAQGYRDGSLVYQQLLTIDGGYVQTQQMDFLGVDQIIFTQQWYRYNSIGLDNIEVSLVPIPAAFWLFGSALAGLGWLRRCGQSSYT